jgi:hypothetical protein
MAGVQHNAHELAARYARRSKQLWPAAYAVLTSQAQLVAKTMQAKVAKFRSTTALSIHIEDTGLAEKTIAPGTDYAWYIEKGVKPGGKGLPRFFDPESADIVAWLQTKLRAGSRSPARGSAAFQSAERELRDRYEGLAWHIRHYGVKAQPFVEPTARELAAPVAQALRDGVIAVLTDGKAPAAAVTAAAPVVAAVAPVAGAPMTWKGFLKQHMGAAMKDARTAGATHHEAHGVALRNLGAQWRARKGRK